MAQVRALFGSDIIRQTTGAGVLRTDFDRALSALKSKVSALAPADSKAQKLLACEPFLKAYVEASEKLGRGYQVPASNDFQMKNAVLLGSSLTLSDAVLLAGWYQEAYNEGKIPLSMWNPAAYLKANPSATGSVTEALITAVGGVKDSALKAVGAVAKLPIEAAATVAAPFVKQAVILLVLGGIGWAFFKGKK